MGIYAPFIVADSEPTDISCIDGAIWFNRVTNEWYKKVEGEWLKIPPPAEVSSDVLFSGRVNFTGDVYADSDKGLTGQKTIGGYTFTFKNGILVGFEGA